MNFCSYCGTQLLAQVSICPQCQHPLRDAPPPAREIGPARAPETPLPLSEPLSENFASYRVQLAEQQVALDQLRRHVQEQLEQQRLLLEKQLLAQKQESVNGPEWAEELAEALPAKRPRLTPWQRKGLALFLLLAALAFLTNLVLIILYSKTNHRADALALGSTALVIFGGFYLAYDLLGRQDGPLVQLTAYMTYALIGTMGASIASAVLIAQNIQIIGILSRLANIDADPATIAGMSPSDALSLAMFTRGALFCLFVGALIGVSGALLTRPYKPRGVALLQALLLELSLCLLFWWLFFNIFIPIFYLPVTNSIPITLIPILFSLVSDSKEGVFLLALLLAITPAFVTFLCMRLYRFFIVNKLSRVQTHRPRLYWAIFAPGTLAFFCIVVLPMLVAVYAAWNGSGHRAPIIGPVGIAAAFALSGTLATIIAPFSVHWVNSLGERALGGVGLGLASLGTVLGIMPVLLDLILK